MDIMGADRDNRTVKSSNPENRSTALKNGYPGSKRILARYLKLQILRRQSRRQSRDLNSDAKFWVNIRGSPKSLVRRPKKFVRATNHAAGTPFYFFWNFQISSELFHEVKLALLSASSARWRSVDGEKYRVRGLNSAVICFFPLAFWFLLCPQARGGSLGFFWDRRLMHILKKMTLRKFSRFTNVVV